MGFFDRLLGRQPAPHPPPTPPPPTQTPGSPPPAASTPRPPDPVGLPSGFREQLRKEGPELDVVGESHYQDALHEICGGRTSDGADHLCTASLVPEPDNIYDENAVAVVIDGQKVGHLAKPMARGLQPVLLWWHSTKGSPLTCPARIVGGWRRGDDVGNFGVRIEFDVDVLP